MRLDRLSEAAKVNTDAMRSAQEEISEYRRQLQARTIEIEGLRGRGSALSWRTVTRLTSHPTRWAGVGQKARPPNLAE